MTPARSDAERAVELAARTAYGRLVALLAARTRDLAAAEDALSDAFVAALAQWPESGVPARPEAWLMAVARRRLLDAARRERVREAASPTIAYAIELDIEDAELADAVPDRRLALLFACAHPAIDAALHTPLMLQAVLGVDAPTIASAFLVAPAAMAQRLVRAKTKIRDAGIAIEVPPAHEFAIRLPPVLEAIYAAYGASWEDVRGADAARRDLGAEATWLARVLHATLPEEPEAAGLLALLLYCESRRAARRDGEGRYVPLDDQPTKLWRRDLRGEAEQLLWTAARAGRPGRFQLEAAIQSAHMARLDGGAADWAAIRGLYDALVTIAPSVGAHVSRAAAVLHADGTDAALALLDAMPGELVHGYQPWWALRAEALARAGQPAAARTAFERAAGMVEDPATRVWLLQRAAGVGPAQR